MTRMIVLLPSWAAFLFLIVPMFASSHIPPPISMPIGLFPYLLWLFSLFIESSRAYSQVSTRAKWILPFALLYVLVYGYVFNSDLIPFKLLLPFHLIAMVCAFSPLYFVAIEVRSAELRRRASAEEWFPTFMALWFFPLGVWFVQKKIQRIVKAA